MTHKAPYNSLLSDFSLVLATFPIIKSDGKATPVLSFSAAPLPGTGGGKEPSSMTEISATVFLAATPRSDHVPVGTSRLAKPERYTCRKQVVWQNCKDAKSPSQLLQIFKEFAIQRLAPQALEGSLLNLPHPLFGKRQLGSNLVQSLGNSFRNAKTHINHRGITHL